MSIHKTIDKVLELDAKGLAASYIKTHVDITQAEVQTILKAKRFCQTQPLPKCCSKEDFIAWMEAIPGFKHAGIRFCQDCTPSYQRKHMERGTCSHPETTFGWMPLEDGGYELYGVNRVQNAYARIKPLTSEEYWDDELPMFK